MTLKVRPLNREIHTDDAIQLIRKNIPLKKYLKKDCRNETNAYFVDEKNDRFS